MNQVIRIKCLGHVYVALVALCKESTAKQRGDTVECRFIPVGKTPGRRHSNPTSILLWRTCAG